MKNNYHDSSLVAIGSADDRVTLTLMLLDGVTVSLVLLEPELFRVCDYIIGNSTSRLFMMDGKYDVAEIEKKILWVSSLDGVTTYLSKRMMDSYVSRVTSQELSLLVLEPSWGRKW